VILKTFLAVGIVICCLTIWIPPHWTAATADWGLPVRCRAIGSVTPHQGWSPKRNNGSLPPSAYISDVLFKILFFHQRFSLSCSLWTSSDIVIVDTS